MGPMGPMGPMGMPIDSNFQQFDQMIGAPPPMNDENEKNFQGYYMAEEQNLGAPLDMEYQFGPEGPQSIDQQMVGGPLDVLLHVRILFV